VKAGDHLFELAQAVWHVGGVAWIGREETNRVVAPVVGDAFLFELAVVDESIAAIQMVTDRMRYWVEEMRVDGFRFDLGTILAREPNGFDNKSGFLKAVGQDPLLGSVKLIAEPWDIGPGGYQVGSFPPGWAGMDR
jgi:hypothetical protein